MSPKAHISLAIAGIGLVHATTCFTFPFFGVVNTFFLADLHKIKKARISPGVRRKIAAVVALSTVLGAAGSYVYNGQKMRSLFVNDRVMQFVQDHLP